MRRDKGTKSAAFKGGRETSANENFNSSHKRRKSIGAEGDEIRVLEEEEGESRFTMGMFYISYLSLYNYIVVHAKAEAGNLVADELDTQVRSTYSVSIPPDDYHGEPPEVPSVALLGNTPAYHDEVAALKQRDHAFSSTRSNKEKMWNENYQNYKKQLTNFKTQITAKYTSPRLWERVKTDVGPTAQQSQATTAIDFLTILLAKIQVQLGWSSSSLVSTIEDELPTYKVKVRGCSSLWLQGTGQVMIQLVQAETKSYEAVLSVPVGVDREAEVGRFRAARVRARSESSRVIEAVCKEFYSHGVPQTTVTTMEALATQSSCDLSECPYSISPSVTRQRRGMDQVLSDFENHTEVVRRREPQTSFYYTKQVYVPRTPKSHEPPPSVQVSAAAISKDSMSLSSGRGLRGAEGKRGARYTPPVSSRSPSPSPKGQPKSTLKIKAGGSPQCPHCTRVLGKEGKAVGHTWAGCFSSPEGSNYKAKRKVPTVSGSGRQRQKDQVSGDADCVSTTTWSDIYISST